MTADLRVIHDEPAAPPRPPRLIRVRKKNPLYRWIRLSFVVTILICLLLVDAAFVAGITSRGLNDSVNHLNAGLGELENGESVAAAKRFDLAYRSASTARSSRLHPAFWVWRTLPGLGDDAAAAVTTSEGLQAVSAAGTALATRNGEDAAVHLGKAQDSLVEAGHATVIERVDAARSSLRAIIGHLVAFGSTP